jgi:hypothetical protein
VALVGVVRLELARVDGQLSTDSGHVKKDVETQLAWGLGEREPGSFFPAVVVVEPRSSVDVSDDARKAAAVPTALRNSGRAPGGGADVLEDLVHDVTAVAEHFAARRVIPGRVIEVLIVRPRAACSYKVRPSRRHTGGGSSGLGPASRSRLICRCASGSIPPHSSIGL